ncbi:Avr9/Cf-9 rapidly elicited protein [Parasponia andersonii]|uniref:Avr9/Cf-9 rapidly elicited protein n=1 Tax=Parasponia andersonii TaxID=3476 RepID=A0A2P5C002_PARAD|nr:Avr9/Cf-9 rapidly elicited protein [Parasponia andersonii]
MEQNAPVVAKRIWGIVRVVFFMLRKGISKRKLLLDLNMMMKRGKIASKAALSNLMTFHTTGSTSFRRSSAAAADSRLSSSSYSAPGDYEFSCSSTPNYGLFHLGKARRHGHHAHNFFTCAHAPPTLDDDVVTANALKAVLEILNNDQAVTAAAAVEASPALPGFGRSPMVRQLRITDSPFPLREADEDSRHVDEAAEEFIKRFYKDLRLQKRMAE